MISETVIKEKYEEIIAEPKEVRDSATAQSIPKAKSLKEDMVTFMPSRHAPSVQLPKIKEIEYLKDGIYSVDIEKTINDMFLVIRNMETQLESVMKINASLERDLSDSKEIISDLKNVNVRLEESIASMEEDIPSKRELQIEIDNQVEERNKAELVIRKLKKQIEEIRTGYSFHKQKTNNLEDQKQDFVVEINYLETRLHEAGRKIKELTHDTNQLKGEKIVQEQKLTALEQELNGIVEEKYRLITELKASKKAVDDLHSTLTDTKMQTKKTFYKGAEAVKPEESEPPPEETSFGGEPKVEQYERETFGELET